MESKLSKESKEGIFNVLFVGEGLESILNLFG